MLGKDDLEELTADDREKLEEKIVSHGLSDVPLTKLNKDKATKDLMTAEVIITRTLAMDSFFKGLDCMGLGKILRENSSISKEVFPTKDDIDIDATMVKERMRTGIHGQHDTRSAEQKLACEWFCKFIDESSSLKG